MNRQEVLDHIAKHGGMLAGQRYPDDFESGWGKHTFKGSVAHHWTADRSTNLGDGAYGIDSACGVVTVVTHQVPLFEPGSYALCQRCEKRLMRAWEKR